MLAAFADGLDVGSLQHWQRVLARNRALAVIGVCDENPESSSPKSTARQYRIRIHATDEPFGDNPLIGDGRAVCHSRFQLPSKLETGSSVKVVCLSLNDVQ